MFTLKYWGQLQAHHISNIKLFMNKVQTEKPQENTTNQETQSEKVLCSHCQRTATNGIKCKGICVADNDY